MSHMTLNMIIPFFTTLELRQKDNFNIETIKNDLKLNKLSVSCSYSETRQRLFHEGTIYISATEPKVFTTHCVNFSLLSAG